MELSWPTPLCFDCLHWRPSPAKASHTRLSQLLRLLLKQRCQGWVDISSYSLHSV